MTFVVDADTGRRLSDYAEFAHLVAAVQGLQLEAQAVVPRLKGRTVWMVNSTAEGGGVAEMLPTMITLMRDLGIATEWAVIESDEPRFFELTKRLHNLKETEMVVVGPTPGAVSVQLASTFEPDDDRVIVRVMQSYGHPQGVMVYRVSWRGKSVVFATDTEGYVNGDQRMVNFAQNADVLIHDAQYTEDHYTGKRAGSPATQGFGHSTAEMACQIAEAADIGQLVLFHHDPNYEDTAIQEIETKARKIFPNTVAARQGQVIELWERATHPTSKAVAPILRIPKKPEHSENWVST